MVELMVAITLSLLLSGAIIAVFIGSRTAYQSTAGVGALSDSGRFALDLIGASVRSAGNLACNSAMTATSQTLFVANFVNNYGQGITGFEANGTGNPPGAIALPALPVVGPPANWTPNLDATLAGLVVQGSDVLVVRSTVPRVPPFYTTVDVAPGAVSVFVTPVSSMATGYAAIADCTKSVIFQSTAATGATAVNLNGALPVGFAAGAVVAPLTTTVYYIGVGSDGDSALFRLEQVNNAGAFNPPEELVPDVENMQVLYGIDPSGTQTASAYVSADQVGVSNVVSIQVALLVATPSGNGPVQALPPLNCAAGPGWCLLQNTVTVPGGTRMRQMFYATINLRDAVN
jgi:type IV pilus assembly protein PilW